MNVVVLTRPGSHHRHVVYSCAVLLPATVGLLAVRTCRGLVAVTIIVWAVTVAVAAVVDMRSGLLLNILVIPGIAIVFGLALFAHTLDGAMLGGLMLGLPMLVTHLVRPDGLGFGDVKFGLLLGAGIGVLAVPLVLAAYLLAAIVHSGVCIAVRTHGRLVPFGPALAAASIVTVLAKLSARL